MNHSTVDLESTRWLARECAERGFRFLDAPFTGSRIAAENGKLFYYLAGDEALVQEMTDVLEATGESHMNCGEAGNATVIKLATNLISAATVQAMSEALGITTAHGIAPELLGTAVSRNASGSPLAAMKFPAMIAGEYDAHFSLDNMAKDCRCMLELAGAENVVVPAILAVTGRMEELLARGLGGEDYSVLAEPYLKNLR